LHLTATRSGAQAEGLHRLGGVQGDSIPLLRPAEGNKQSALGIGSDALVAWLKFFATGFFGIPACITLMKIRLHYFIT